jgi:transposase InsO family protein
MASPTKNAYIERSNRTYRHEVLDAYLLTYIEQVQNITEEWLLEYNEQRPHDALGRSAAKAIPAQVDHRRRSQKRTVYLTGKLTAPLTALRNATVPLLLIRTGSLGKRHSLR